MTVAGWAPPDIEAGFAALLDASTRVPNPRPDSFVQVTATGGTQTALTLATTRVTVECWGPDETAALGLARAAYAKCWSVRSTYLTPGCFVTRMELTSPVNFPDPNSGSARYQFVAQATVALTPVEV